jgi:hypothetical protein
MPDDYERELAWLRAGDITTWNTWRAQRGLFGIENWVPSHTSIDVAYESPPLSGADLSNLNLRGVNFRGCTLNGARLSGSDLHSADLSWSELNDADLKGAYLELTNLYFSSMKRADLTSATLGLTLLGSANLSEAIGLETCSHLIGSCIDSSTLQKSGHLPLDFLRGCGMPEMLIDYLPSLLLRHPVQFHSCFISYSRQDRDVAERIHSDLQSNGVRCWFAPKHIRGGEKLYDQIDEAIQVHDRLLLILSEHSMNSEWVRSEIARARQKEVFQRRRVLFPISVVPFSTLREWTCFDADTGKDTAREIREYFVPDFSNWRDPNQYRNALARLLSDLQTTKQG